MHYTTITFLPLTDTNMVYCRLIAVTGKLSRVGGAVSQVQPVADQLSSYISMVAKVCYKHSSQKTRTHLATPPATQLVYLPSPLRFIFLHIPPLLACYNSRKFHSLPSRVSQQSGPQHSESIGNFFSCQNSRCGVCVNDFSDSSCAKVV